MAVCALLVLAPQTWADWVADRPADVPRLRRRLTEWGRTQGIPEFRDFGDRVRIDEACERPVYHVVSVTLDETRQIARVLQPHAQPGALVRTVSDPDLWATPTPAFEGFTRREFQLPVKGSARSFRCAWCADPSGRSESCLKCRGLGQVAESFEVVVTVTPRERPAAISALPAKWSNLVPPDDRWDTLSPAEFAKAAEAVTEADLRKRLEEAAAASAKGLAGVARGTRIRVQRVPCVYAAIAHGGLDYTLLETPSGILFDRSPVARWASAKVEEAGVLLREGRTEEAQLALEAALLADSASDPTGAARDKIREWDERTARMQAIVHEQAAVKRGALVGLFILAALIAIAMVALKIYLVRRRRAAAA